MKKILLYFTIVLLTFFISCTKDDSFGESSDPSLAIGDFDGSGFSSGSSSSSGSGSTDPGGGQGGQSGLITAAEWNDLENWPFWNDLINGEDYLDKLGYWGFYNNNRISVLVTNNTQPIIDAPVQLLKGGSIVWEAKTDNNGTAELWIDIFAENQSVDLTDYILAINGETVTEDLKFYSEGINEINLNTIQTESDRLELSFIVDATGSMGDELEFLKDDLVDVIQRVQDNNTALQIYTSNVFYRDEGDEYLVRKSDFSNDISTTLNFINNQSANGGGDTPEAVHTGLKTSIEELQWSENAKARIAFLLLDAPPHHNPQVIGDLQNSIKIAARKGIKIIPITASGIDKETEFLMRFFSITTNSTYVFITNDSGIGNDHIAASVGEFEVEFLNDLMVRLITEYTE